MGDTKPSLSEPGPKGSRGGGNSRHPAPEPHEIVRPVSARPTFASHESKQCRHPSWNGKHCAFERVPGRLYCPIHLK